ncbi:uncharacterized protein LOC143233140 isoform X1 [Tachypleus tridentatus]|uniref:uncharacterized protein LOC143233140 isoform X1 n=1 Tax=Tachypleus tridentatus TaxID=6853 RepID=UPI003FD2E31C
MSFAHQLGYTTYPGNNPQLLRSTGQAGPSGTSCCDTPRSLLETDPHAVQQQLPTSPAAGCPLPPAYDSRLLSAYPQLATNLTGSSRFYNGASYTADQANFHGFTGVDSSAFYPTALNSAYTMKESVDSPWRSIPQPASYYYDSALASYGYGGLELNVARRKNVTRDSTSTLKAWLNEHRKNPYPTKGEKIMLAIITKMTLTQVSTWFANARRRLKRDNKMTWEPRNKAETDPDENLDVKKVIDIDEQETRDEIDKGGDSCENSDARRCDVNICSNAAANEETFILTDDCSESSRTEQDCNMKSNTITGPDDGIYHYNKTNGEQSLTHFRNALSSQNTSFTGSRNYHISRNYQHQYGLSANVANFTPSGSSASPSPDLSGIGPFICSHRDLSRDSKEDPDTNCEIPEENPSKPKIWSLADTATNKSPQPHLQSPFIPGVQDCSGPRSWITSGRSGETISNPHDKIPGLFPNSVYTDCITSSNTISQPSSKPVVYNGGAPTFSPLPPHADTPPETPPNIRFSCNVPLYLGYSAANNYMATQHVTTQSYLTNGLTSPEGTSTNNLSHITGDKLGNVYSVNYVGSSSYRPDCVINGYYDH